MNQVPSQQNRMDSLYQKTLEPEPSHRVLKIENYCNVVSTLATQQTLNKEQEDQVVAGLGEINENLEHLTATPVLFSQFYNHSLQIILNYLLNGPKNFLSEHAGHQIRKTLLEILYRIPFAENRQHLNKILPSIYHVIENDNEENAIIALRIANDMHRKMLPQKMLEEGKKLLAIFRKMALSFLQNVSKILEPRAPFPEQTQAEINIPALLTEIFFATNILIEGNKVMILPRGLYSLKLFAEVPVACIFMSNLFKTSVESEMWEIVRMGINIISHQPTAVQRANPLFNHESYVDFVTVQVKFLSLIGYFAKQHDDKIITNATFVPERLPQLVVNLLANCPQNAPHIRKDILSAIRALIATSYRKYFAPHIEPFLDEDIVIGSGWTSREALRSMAYGVIYDLLHHIREHLTQKQLQMALHCYSKNLYDDTLNLMIHIMTCRLMLNLADSFCKGADKENQRQGKTEVEVRLLLLKLFDLFTNKIDCIVKFVIPAITIKTATTTPPSLPPIITLETLAASSSPPPPVIPDSLSTNFSSDNNDFNDPIIPDTFPQTNDAPLCHEDLRIKFGFPESSVNYSLTECRMLVKTLINGLKVLAYKMKEYSERYETAHNAAAMQAAVAQQQQAAAQAAAANQQPPPPILPQLTIRNGFCRPKDLTLLVRLFKQGLKVFDIYNVQNQVAAANAAAAAAASNSTSAPGQKKEEQPGKDKDKAAPGGGVAPGGEKGSGEKAAVNPTPSPQRTKEEKELIDSFSAVFISLAPQTFRVVIRETMEHFVKCINENNSIQLIANNFLSNRATSLIFSNLLVEFLLARMDVMGANSELSNLYLRLFKLVFGSVSLFPNDNELMLKPHLHKIVNNSMKMALNAKEPYNYFLLLRALFRSIGGGSHDLLYQEFLPMLPSLLQGLNSLQSGIHRQNMKDLFVELCLTIPVRLSSLLPYLPWLMDPLVSALNGTQNLISQGLRTLELCVDNLQPDFLYEHIQPIRTELMQALWRTLRHPVEHIAQVSFRILGKLGGSNHKLMIEPQKLEWIDYRDPALLSSTVQHFSASGEPVSQAATLQMMDAISPLHMPTHNAYSFVSIYYSEASINSTHPNQHTVNHSTPICLPIDKVIDTAYRGLRQPGTDSFYRQQCWEVIKGFFVAHIQTISTNEEKQILHKLFLNSSLTTSDLPSFSSSASGGSSGSFSGASNLFGTAQLYKFPDEKLRKVHELALTAMLTAAAIKELYNTVLLFMVPLVRHYTLVAICQQAAGPGSGLMYTIGTGRSTGTSPKFFGMDPLVLVDAVATVMGQEENELCKPCHLVLRLICDTAVSVLGSKERASQLPLYGYILERVCALCYDRPWYSKYGGCFAVRFLFKQMSLRWLFDHQFVILKAMLFVMMDLAGDLSSGVIEMARENLDVMIKMCAAPLEATVGQRELAEAQRKSMLDVTQDLLRQLTSPHTLVREESMHLLIVLAQTTGQSVTEVMTPHKDILVDMIPPRRHKLLQQPPTVQIGLLDGNTFCTTLEPPLFTIDINIPEHLNFFNDVHTIADNTDAVLQKYNCYKGLESLVPLKKSCLKVLAACHHIPTLRTRIFTVLYKALDSSEIELQECAFQCLDKYKTLKDVDSDLIRGGIRNLIRNISDHRTLTASSVIRLKYLARLFTYIFNDKFCEQFLQHLLRITEGAVQTIRKWKERDYKLKLVAQQQAQQQNEGNQNQPTAAQQAQSAYEQNSKINHLDIHHQANVCIEIINLFTEITAADSTYVEHLMKFLMKTENSLDTFGAFKFYEPIRKFMQRYPQQTISLLERYYAEINVFRFFEYLISGEGGALFRTVLYDNSTKMVTVLRNQAIALGALKSEESTPVDAPAPVGLAGSSGSGAATPKSLERFHAIKIISILIKHDGNWLSTQPEMVHLLRSIWFTEAFHQEHTSSLVMDYPQWSEPKLLSRCLLAYFKINQKTEIDTLFQLLRAFNYKYHCDVEFLRTYLSEVVMKSFSVEWKRAAFIRFVEIFREEIDHGSSAWSQLMIAKIMQFVIIPMFSYAFESGEAERLLGPPAPAITNAQEKPEQPDLVFIFVTNIIDDKLPISDGVRICVLQLSSLIIEHASAYVRGNPKRQEKLAIKSQEYNPVRKLMNYAWGCLGVSNNMDPANRYYGHLLLALFITRMAIHKRIVRQVFISLMRATTVEARPVVRAALDVMTYQMTQRLDDGKLMLAKLTRSIITEESYQISQVINMMQIIIRNHRQYYETRHQLIPHMVNTINRFGLTPNSSLENRRIALDLVEVIIRWEFHRKQETLEQGTSGSSTGGRSGSGLSTPVGQKRTHEKMEIDSPVGGSNDSFGTPKKEIFVGSINDHISKDHADAIVNFLVRFACLINDFGHPQQLFGQNGCYTIHSQGQSSTTAQMTAEYLGRRSLALVKIILQTDIWPFMEFRIQMIERALSVVKETNTGNHSVCMALELLTIFLQTMKKEAVLKIFIGIQKAISMTCNCNSSRVVRTMHSLLTKLMAIFPPSCANTTISPKSGAPVKVVQDQLEPLEQLYTDIHSIILNGFGVYDKATCISSAQNIAQLSACNQSGQMSTPQNANLGQDITSTLQSLFGTLMILKAACINQPSYIDRLLTPFIHMLQKLVKEHLILSRLLSTPNLSDTQLNTTLCVELIVLSLDLVKNRLGAMSPDMRRTFISNVFITLIDKSPDVKVMKAILNIFEEWIKQPFSGQQGRTSGGGTHHPIAPLIREKVTLLTRISMNIEKRMADDTELNALFLDLIYYIYTDDTLRTSDLAAKLELSFMSGLRCSQPSIRQKFFSVMDNVIRKRLYDRLMYIVCEQNWETMMGHYWIKQCIELVLAIANHHVPLSTPNTFATLPLPTSFVTSVSDQYGEKYPGFSSGTSSGSGMDFAMNNDILIDFDFIGTPSAHVQDRNAGFTTDVEMPDFSGNSEADAGSDAASCSNQHDQSAAAANSFYNDLFGNQTVNPASAQSQTTPHRDRSGSVGSGTGPTSATAGTQPFGHKQSMFNKVGDFLLHLQQVKSASFINAVAQLCHIDSPLAHHIWVQLFPRIYSIMGDKQQLLIALQLAPFFVSGSHLLQRDVPISSISTFYEAIACCKPQITLRPSMMKYIGKNHNAWHRVSLMLEGALDKAEPTTPSIGLGGLLVNGTNVVNRQQLQVQGSGLNQKNTRGSNNTTTSGQDGNTSAPGQLPATNHHEIFPAELSQPCVTYSQDCATVLGQIYELLREEDYWAGIWQREAHFNETKIGIAYEQMGFFEQAKGAYELAMSKARNEFTGTNPAPHIFKGEYCLWEQHWIRCSKELNQWDFLLEYANSTESKNPLLVMESAWRIPDWDQMHDAIQFVEQNVTKEHVWKLALYKGYDHICNPKHRELDQVQKMVDTATSNLIKEWRRLPPLVSSVHIEYLHAAHQVIELQEAGLLHQSIFNGGVPTSGSLGPSGHERTAPIDLRAVIKTWKNRLPILADDLSHWSDIFTWRQHHYQAVVSRYEMEAARPGNSLASQNALLGAHASAQSLIHYAKIARKHSLATVSLDSLNRIHTIPKVPIIDCFQKIRQQLKCYLLLHHMQPTGDEIQEGLSVIESTHLKYFQRDMIGEFYAMKGHFLVKLGQLDEANKTFSVATQIQDTLVKAWALWGEYYEELFTSPDLPFEARNLELGSAAIIAYLHSCRHQNETKARKYLSKVLWLQSYDDESGTLAKVTDRYNTGVPPVNWLPWVPQLVLQCLTRQEGSHLFNLLTTISKLYVQAVYYPVRTLFLTNRLEIRELKYKHGMIAAGYNSNNTEKLQQQPGEQGLLAPSCMVRCTKLMHHQREHSPTVLSTLEGIIDQLSWFRENWYEEVLRQLRQALAKCYTSAFEHRANVADTPISPYTFSFVRKLISTFGIGVENVANQNGASTSATAGSDDVSATGFHKSPIRADGSNGTSESLLTKRAHATLQDPVFQKLKHQFTIDFDFSQASSKKLHILILKLKKWIKILEAKTKLLPKSWLLEEKCRYLANFSSQTVDIAVPGEFFLPKINIVSIARFMPRVEVVGKHNSTARRLNIRGQNGKMYPYLVLSDSSVSDARREERFLQLQRLLNFYVWKHKETARRLLNFTVPRVISFAPQTRFVEDNPTSLSLIEIYKHHVIRKGSDPDAPIAKYYDRLVSVQTKGSQTTLSIFHDIITDIQASLAPKTLIKEWAMQTFNTAPDFWHFRKQFTLQLGLADFCEFSFHLNRLNPDMMYIHRDSGLINISYYRFDLGDDTGEFTSTHQVPFRLTYSTQDFVTKFGIQGPMTATMISTASCLTHPNYKVRSILCAILRDEIISWNRRIKSNEKIHYITSLAAQIHQAAQANTESSDQKESGATGEKPQQQIPPALAAALAQSQSSDTPEIVGEELVNLTKKAANSIMSRLTSLSSFEGSDSKAAALISLAISHDNLARMDPAWHPWL